MKVFLVIVLFLSILKCIELSPVKKDSAVTPSTVKPKRTSTVHPFTASTIRRTSVLVLTKSDGSIDQKDEDEGVHLELSLNNSSPKKVKEKPPLRNNKAPPSTKPKPKVENTKKKRSTTTTTTTTKPKKHEEKSEDDDESSIFSDIRQGYKKVYNKISQWWKALDDSFSDEPNNKENGNKVKKETKQNKDSKPKPAAQKKKPTTKPPSASASPPKKDNKHKETEGSWFDLERVVVILGGIVTVLDLFGIR